MVSPDRIKQHLPFVDTIRNTYLDALNNYAKPDGCRNKVQQCRTAGKLSNPDEVAMNTTINQICVEAAACCSQYVPGAYGTESSLFDMFHFNPDPQPPLRRGFC